MDLLTSKYIAYVVIGVLTIFIIFTIIKKLIKVVLFILAIAVLFSAYNVFIKGESPIEEIKGYEVNLSYSKTITEYTFKIKNSANTIKTIIESNKLNAENIVILNKENANLKAYQVKVVQLPHTKKLNGFHQAYCSYLNTIVESSERTIQVVNGLESQKDNSVFKFVDQLAKGVLELSNLKINSKE